MSMFMSNVFIYENKNPPRNKAREGKKKILPWVLLYDFCVEWFDDSKFCFLQIKLCNILMKTRTAISFWLSLLNYRLNWQTRTEWTSRAVIWTPVSDFSEAGHLKRRGSRVAGRPDPTVSIQKWTILAGKLKWNPAQQSTQKANISPLNIYRHLLGEHSCDTGKHQQEKEVLSLEKLLWYDNGIWPL